MVQNHMKTAFDKVLIGQTGMIVEEGYYNISPNL